MKLTKSQQDIVDKIKNFGGVAWVGAFPNGFHEFYNEYCKIYKKIYGDEKFEELNQKFASLGLTNAKIVKCNLSVLQKMIKLNIVSPVDELNGVFIVC